jgi:hypothetical protein
MYSALARGLLLVCVSTGMASIDRAVMAAPRETGARIPDNIVVSENVRDDFAIFLEKSPTLQRQCERINAARHVRVVVRLARRTMDGPGQARTTFRRYRSGGIIADVDVPFGERFVELLAHELEHVLEQIDGVDLRAMAAGGAPGVTELREGIYETERARAAGRAAGCEIHGEVGPKLASAGRGVGRVLRGFWRAAVVAPLNALDGARAHRRDNAAGKEHM